MTSLIGGETKTKYREGSKDLAREHHGLSRSLVRVKHPTSYAESRRDEKLM